MRILVACEESIVLDYEYSSEEPCAVIMPAVGEAGGMADGPQPAGICGNGVLRMGLCRTGDCEVFGDAVRRLQ